MHIQGNLITHQPINRSNISNPSVRSAQFAGLSETQKIQAVEALFDEVMTDFASGNYVMLGFVGEAARVQLGTSKRIYQIQLIKENQTYGFSFNEEINGLACKPPSNHGLIRAFQTSPSGVSFNYLFTEGLASGVISPPLFSGHVGPPIPICRGEKLKAVYTAPGQERISIDAEGFTGAGTNYYVNPQYDKLKDQGEKIIRLLEQHIFTPANRAKFSSSTV